METEAMHDFMTLCWKKVIMKRIRVIYRGAFLLLILITFACDNLRLIKRPGKNRWSKQSKMWSEAALGEDRKGNILLIFCRSPYSMHDFNNNLLKLPIDIVCAQHLEGGPEASLYFRYKGIKIEKCGSFETFFNENDQNNGAWDVPNILGFVKKGVYDGT